MHRFKKLHVTLRRKKWFKGLTLQSERAVVYQIVVELFYGVENKSLQPVVAYIQIEEGENTGEESGWESRQPVVAEIYRL